MINTYFLEKRIESLRFWVDVVRFNGLEDVPDPFIHSPEQRKEMQERIQELSSQPHDIKNADYE